MSDPYSDPNSEPRSDYDFGEDDSRFGDYTQDEREDSLPVSGVSERSTLSESVSKPEPLIGCLYCHTEGATALSDAPKLFGRFTIGSNLPVLTCSACHSVALFDHYEPQRETGWRIKYRKVNRAPRFYYVMLNMTGWLEAEEAITVSMRGYAQRQRVVQAQRGDLAWLNPIPLDPPPPLMSADECVYLSINPVTYQQGKNTPKAAQNKDGEKNIEKPAKPTTMNETVLDSGRFYLTDRKLHLLGHRRDWSHKLSDITGVEHDDKFWRIYVDNTYYQGSNHAEGIDAQLMTAIVNAVRRQTT